MADRDFGTHVVEQIVEVGPVIHIRQQRAVHLLHLRPVAAVRVGHVQVVALMPPAFVEDLLELFSGFEIHAERRVEAALVRLRSVPVGVDQEQTDTAAFGAAATSAAAAAPAARPVEQFASIRADVVLGHTLHEGGGAPIGEAITMQRASASATTSSTPTARSSFEVEDR